MLERLTYPVLSIFCSLGLVGNIQHKSLSLARSYDRLCENMTEKTELGGPMSDSNSCDETGLLKIDDADIRLFPRKHVGRLVFR
jgi:hypothetical protein